MIQPDDFAWPPMRYARNRFGVSRGTEMTIKHSFVTAAAIVCGLVVLAAREAYAMRAVVWTAHPQALRVDDDDWFPPLWFGFRAFIPRREVIIERNDYPPPPPPQPAFYYYCRYPQGYYPRIPSCPSGWLRVLPPDDGGPP
jgi:hypothetical protein